MPARRTRPCAPSFEAYGHGLADKPEIVALNKADAIPADELKRQASRLKRTAGKTPLILSGATGPGVPEALRALAAVIDETRGVRQSASEAAARRP